MPCPQIAAALEEPSDTRASRWQVLCHADELVRSVQQLQTRDCQRQRFLTVAQAQGWTAPQGGDLCLPPTRNLPACKNAPCRLEQHGGPRWGAPSAMEHGTTDTGCPAYTLQDIGSGGDWHMQVGLESGNHPGPKEWDSSLAESSPHDVLGGLLLLSSSYMVITPRRSPLRNRTSQMPRGLRDSSWPSSHCT
ncbi:hypothetical protein NDU88_002416 [Pleurodeles waltl]|uniref:Uncharacterized protein n=1 Tax=Pleurodeles waltl TaxID=8319 RepID=A0AAV7T2P7_PLEWA|nr:hypothetical protein NDU88_002416 [Pleurodeles waltl]